MFLLNPWFLAGAIFTAIGLLQEAGKEKNGDQKKVGGIPTGEKKSTKTASPVTVNVHGTEVKSPKEPKQKAKPSAKVPTEPPTGGDG